MQVQPIASLGCNTSHVQFKGLWDERIRYSHHTWEPKYDCDYFVHDYYPFADETKEEIEQNVKKHLNEIQAKEEYGKNPYDFAIKCTHTTAKVKRALSITKGDYIKFLEGVLPDSIKDFERILRVAELLKR